MAIQGLEFDKPKLENGGQSQEAIVVTSPDKQPVNAPTVEDIKRIAKGEAETEGDKSYTKAESDTKFLSKTDAASTYAAKNSVYTKTESDANYQAKLTMPLVTNINHDAQFDYSADDVSGLANAKLVGIDILANNGYDDYPFFVTGHVVEDENDITIKTCFIVGLNWEEAIELYEIKISKSTKAVLFNDGSSGSGMHLNATFKIYKIF